MRDRRGTTRSAAAGLARARGRLRMRLALLLILTVSQCVLGLRLRVPTFHVPIPCVRDLDCGPGGRCWVPGLGLCGPLQSPAADQQASATASRQTPTRAAAPFNSSAPLSVERQESGSGRWLLTAAPGRCRSARPASGTSSAPASTAGRPEWEPAASTGAVTPVSRQSGATAAGVCRGGCTGPRAPPPSSVCPRAAEEDSAAVRTATAPPRNGAARRASACQ